MSKLLAQQEAIEAAEVFLLSTLLDNDPDEENSELEKLDEQEEQEDLTSLSYAIATSNRYIDRPLYKRKRDDHFFTTKFYNYADAEFLQIFRTSRYGLAVITELIEGNDIFLNGSSYSQTHPAWQLAIALRRLGHYGSSATPQAIASDVEISTGSVVEFTNRVITALVSISCDWIIWPDEDERADHGRKMRKKGFPGCVGFVDGTILPLAFGPSQEGACYFDRKKRYGVDTAIIYLCDQKNKNITRN